MAGPKTHLVILLIAFANAKLINGSPLHIDDVVDEQYSAGSFLSVSSSGDTVHLINKDIDETISGMSSTSTSSFDTRMFIGEFSGKGNSVWSDKPNQIVIIKDNKKCQQITYNKRVRVSSETLSTSECAKVLDKVKLMEQDVDNLYREMDQMSQDMEESMAGMLSNNDDDDDSDFFGNY